MTRNLFEIDRGEYFLYSGKFYEVMGAGSPIDMIVCKEVESGNVENFQPSILVNHLANVRKVYNVIRRNGNNCYLTMDEAVVFADEDEPIVEVVVVKLALDFYCMLESRVDIKKLTNKDFRRSALKKLTEEEIAVVRKEPTRRFLMTKLTDMEKEALGLDK